MEEKIKKVNFLDFLSSITPEESELKIEFIANGTYGYAFKCNLGKRSFVIKFSLFFKYGKNDSECQYNDIERPENVEHTMLNLLMNIFHRNICLGRC